MGQLESKVAIITGGTAGIGLTAAQRFTEEGAVDAQGDVPKGETRD